MSVIRLYDICPTARIRGAENREVSGITDNTAEFKTGDIFVCIKGARFDGHSVAKSMLDKGAAAVIVERDMGLANQVIYPDTRIALSELSSAFYGYPTKQMQMFAVTGTNGKTTTAHILQGILQEMGKKCGCIGTAGNDLCGEVVTSVRGTATTPTAPVLYSWFRRMRDNGAECCVIEASSQALHQHRIASESFAACGFTNLTHDHLDYHGSMEEYYKAKKMLFSMSQNSAVCIDDEYGKRLSREIDGVITFSCVENADIYASFIKLSGFGSEFIITSEKNKKSVRVKLPLIGKYNIQNALCAVSMATAAGYDFVKAALALEKCHGVAGRMNVVYSGEFTVITDYAHTDDALGKMLPAVRESTDGRIILVFGAAGDRDSEKRPEMGRAAANGADILIITSDNPAHENPDDIIAAVKSGVPDNTECYTKTDRSKAIELALSMAKAGDIVVLAGKGHETYQIIGDEYIPFCEADIVKEILQGKGKPIK